MAKAGRPKNGSAGLPEWFDIRKYLDARDLGAMGWLEQLIFRGRTLIGCDDCIRAGDTEFKRLDVALKMLQEDPIITEERVSKTRTSIIDGETQYNDPESGDWTILTGAISTDPIVGMTIRPRPGRGITLLTLGDRDAIMPDAFNDEQGIVRHFTRHEDGQWDINDPLLHWRGQPVITFDPSLKPEIIMREMGDLVRKLHRAEKTTPFAFTKNSDFSKWYNSGVLPYIDLKLWESMGYEFKWSAFISELNQILDKPISSEGAAIKSAQSYCQKLLNVQTLQILEAQAIRERQSGAEKSRKFLVT